MEAGSHHVAGEQRGIARHPLGNLAQRQVGVGDQHLVGLGALERAERRAMTEDAALVALVEVAAATEEAAPAGRAVAAEHAVSDRHLGHAVGRRDHLADELVADREAGLDADAAVVDVEVRPADPGRLDADDRVGRTLELRLGLVVDPDLPGRLERDRAHRANRTVRRLAAV